MRKFTAIAMMIAAFQVILVSQPMCAARRKPAPKPAAVKPVAPAIPCYPGGQVDLEITLTKQDILPMVQGLLKNAFVSTGDHSFSLGVKTGPVADASPSADPKALGASDTEKPKVSISLEDVFARVAGVYILQVSVPKLTDGKMLDDYYGRFPKAKNMNRVFFQRDDHGGSIQFWSGPGGNGLYGVRIYSEDYNTSPAQMKVQAARLDGTVDVSKLLTAENVKALMGVVGVKS